MNNMFKDERVKRGILIGIVLILVYWAINNIQMFVSVFNWFLAITLPFVVGCVIAFIFNVPMKAIEKGIINRGKLRAEKFASLRRVLAYLLTLIIIIAVCTLIILIIVPQLIETITETIKEVPEVAMNLKNWALKKSDDYPQIEEYINSINIDWISVGQSVYKFMSEGTVGIITGGIGAVGSIISGFTTFLIGFVFSIYILLQKEGLIRQSKKVLYAFFPKAKVERFIEIAKITNVTFSNFISGQCLEACILGTLFVISMSILRLPYPLLTGVTIAVTALIPIVGAFIGCIVGMILIAMTSPIKALVFLVLFLVLQQIEGNLIYPHVVGNSVGLPGIWVLAAVTIGGNLFGVFGMLVFIPMCSVVYALFREHVNARLRNKNLS